MKELAALAALTIACGAPAHAQPAAAPPPAPPPAPADDTTEPADADDAGPEDASDQLPSPGTVAVAAPSPRAALLAEANRQLDQHKVSHYVHHTHVDEARGVFDYDCSGFVGYALSRVAPGAFDDVVHASRPRPLAKDFEAFFTSPSGHWHRVELARDLLPGDVIAWLEPPAKHSRNTGHVMIVAAAPTAGARPNEVVVQIIDSSHSGHGKADARLRDHTSGIGTGKLILLTDDAGHPTGYRWSLSKISIPYTTAVALGRLP